jgi:pyruvate,water dikinase
MAQHMKYLIPLSESTPADRDQMGGKAAALAQLASVQHQDFVVPPGFVLTTQAYLEYFHNGTASIPSELLQQILAQFDHLGSKSVAVRSSAASEDGSASSWAGQFTTHLYVTRNRLLESIVGCWQSFKTPATQSYINQRGLESSQQSKGMAVLIQQMVESEVAGVIFTKNPVSQLKTEIVIEAVAGQGEQLAQGDVTPAHFVWDTVTDQLVSESGSSSSHTDVRQLLTENELKKLVTIGKDLEKFFGAPQDIEWAKVGQQIYILQSRPITT